jgi:hypothetical protein
MVVPLVPGCPQTTQNRELSKETRPVGVAFNCGNLDIDADFPYYPQRGSMYDIQIPDPLYVQAQRAAAAYGLTVDAYVQKALQLQLEEEGAVRLTAKQEAIVAKAEADIDAGKFLAAGQMREYFTKKKSA